MKKIGETIMPKSRQVVIRLTPSEAIALHGALVHAERHAALAAVSWVWPLVDATPEYRAQYKALDTLIVEAIRAATGRPSWS